MFINKKIFSLFLASAALFIFTTRASALFGLRARAAQKQMIADAEASFKQGNYQKSEDILKEFLLRNAPKRRIKKAYLLLGQVYHATKEYNKELLTYREAVEFFPKDVSLNLAMADIYYLSGLYDRASEVYQTVLKLDAENMQAKLGLARVYMQQGFFERASQYFREYTEAEKDVPYQVYYDYALSQLKANKLNEALGLAYHAYEINENPQAMFLIAQIYHAEQDEDEALRAITHACEARPDNDEYLLTRALWLAGREESAKEGFAVAEKYLAARPQDKLALFICYTACRTTGKEKEGREFLRKIVMQDGNGFIDKLAAKLLK